jgi:quinol monooxygenase YgiN
MIHVLAIITAKPGARAALLELFHANVPAVRSEDGCIEYGAAIDAEGAGSFASPFGSDTFVVIEKWESPAALAAHARSPHMAEYAAKAKELTADRAIHMLTPA